MLGERAEEEIKDMTVKKITPVLFVEGMKVMFTALDDEVTDPPLINPIKPPVVTPLPIDIELAVRVPFTAMLLMLPPNI